MALEALPNNTNGQDRPLLIEAESALYRALLEHRQIMTFHQEGGISDAEFSPDGERVVTSGFDKTARVWNVRDGSEIAILKGHQAAIERAMFSLDGTRVVTAAHDGTARIWNAATGEQLFVLEQPGEVHTATYSADGALILTASEQSNATIWNARTGQKIATAQGLQTTLPSLSADGRIFAAGQGDRKHPHLEHG